MEREQVAFNPTVAGRNYGIDALRMLAMFMIVILHILGQGSVLASCERLSPQYKAAWVLEIAAYCAVNCYALISGYVGLASKYKYTNIIMLWLRAAFYMILITAIGQIVRPDLVSWKTWVLSCVPILSGKYWYLTAYFILFLVIPLLNMIVDKLSKKQFTVLLAELLIFTSILPTLAMKDPFKLSKGYSAWWLIILYLLGAYIKKYGLCEKRSKWFWLGIYVAAVAVTWTSKIGIDIFIGHGSGFFVSYISPTIVIAAIALFQFFKRIEFPSWGNKCIAFFAPVTFSVFLIHVHPLIWKNMMADGFVSLASKRTVVLILLVLGFALAIYIGCSLIDKVREKLFKMLKIKQRMSELEKKYIGDIWKI